jgi:2-phospho-L-lactate guanylyltransferase
VLVVPVKRLSTAKSRLRGALPGVPHERLALALALDTVAAAVRCADVLVVTDDPLAGAELAALGARVVPDPVGPDADGAGLNAALAHGADLVPGMFDGAAGPGGPPGAARSAGPERRIGALTADLSALRPADLAAALAEAAATPPGRAFVADAAGTGTTLLLAAPGGPLAPRFGPGSARAHAAGGARPLAGGWPTLRRDVDTAGDLAAAARLGLGLHTAALVRGARCRC